MKKLKLLAAVLLLLTSLYSCKKDSKKPVTIEGAWVGTYVNDASGNSFFYKLVFNADGSMEEINQAGETIGIGEWDLDGDILEGRYFWESGTEFSILAAFYKNEGKLLGNWGYGSSATNGGTFDLSK